MQKIFPHLWYDKEAREAAEFYVSIFPNSRVINETTLSDTPSGDANMITFELWGQKFMAINAGPLFKFNPSVSFIVNFDPLLFGSAEKVAREKLDQVWNKLSEGGTALMPLDKYPFSERYGWVQDKYGLTWQLMLTDPKGEQRPPIIPALLFIGNNTGKAEEAINFYLTVFKNSKIGALHRYGNDQKMNKEGTVMFADFMLENTWFAAMDNAYEHKFNFNEAVSFLVNCDNQQEIDYYFEKLSAVPESEQCGWLKDKYGLSWQISPTELEEMLVTGTQEQIDRVTRAFMPMKKLQLEPLRKAFNN